MFADSTTRYREAPDGHLSADGHRLADERGDDDGSWTRPAGGNGRCVSRWRAGEGTLAAADRERRTVESIDGSNMTTRPGVVGKPQLAKLVAAILIGLGIGTLVPTRPVSVPGVGTVSGVLVGVVGLGAGVVLYRWAPGRAASSGCGCSGDCGCE